MIWEYWAATRGLGSCKRLEGSKKQTNKTSQVALVRAKEPNNTETPEDTYPKARDAISNEEGRDFKNTWIREAVKNRISSSCSWSVKGAEVRKAEKRSRIKERIFTCSGNEISEKALQLFVFVEIQGIRGDTSVRQIINIGVSLAGKLEHVLKPGEDQGFGVDPNEGIAHQGCLILLLSVVSVLSIVSRKEKEYLGIVTGKNPQQEDWRCVKPRMWGIPRRVPESNFPYGRGSGKV